METFGWGFGVCVLLPGALILSLILLATAKKKKARPPTIIILMLALWVPVLILVAGTINSMNKPAKEQSK